MDREKERGKKTSRTSVLDRVDSYATKISYSVFSSSPTPSAR